MRRGVIALVAALVAASPGRAVAGAPLQSLNSSFGLNTITFDPNTGLQWLDLTESTGYSKSQMQTEILPGGDFSYTQGFTAEPPPFAGVVAASDLAWFDNDPPQSPSYPTASIGRVGFGGGRSDGASADVGSWLIVPESDAAASSLAALLVIASRRRAWRRCEGVVSR